MKFKLVLMVSFVAIGLVIIPLHADAAVRVKGYMKSNGTYVAPSYRSSPNTSKFDNYSTKGNYNPYSGKSGTRNPYRY